MDQKLPGGPPLPWVRLRAAESSVRADRLLGDPAVLAVAVDDLCWEIARTEWRRREPSHWQFRRLARWHAEGAVLAAERDRIRRLARRYGLPVV